MADIRIFSYLPNPRLYKATIAARFSGASIEIIGARPPELPDWLWDHDARPLTDADKADLAHLKRIARTGFSGGLYKTDAFLAANPFGAVPAAFGGDGTIGLFESNSIMRAAARLGPDVESIYGGGPLILSRIDSFLDRNLVFARDLQRYLLGGREMTDELHAAMENEAHAYFGGIEQALSNTAFVATDTVTLADIAFACDTCQFGNERGFAEEFAEAGYKPLVPLLSAYPRVLAHLVKLRTDPRFAEDLDRYMKHLPLAA